MTHAELVQRGVNWFKNNRISTMRYPIVLPEFGCYASSIPDVIGLNHTATAVIECKVSRSDYLADKRKCHRNYKVQLGNYRYYLVPVGLITVDEVNSGWGLLYCHAHKITVENESEFHENAQTREQEYQVMYSIIRRLMSYDGHDATLKMLRESGK